MPGAHAVSDSSASRPARVSTNVKPQPMAPSLKQFLHESPYSPVLFGLIFIALWAFISFLISRGGWYTFASRYQAQSRPDGGAWGSPFTTFGLLRSHYTYCVRVVFCDAGVYFSTSLHGTSVPCALYGPVDQREAG